MKARGRRRAGATTDGITTVAYQTNPAARAGATADGSLNSGTSPARDVSAMLRRAGLRPTRQRLALGRLLYGDGDRHLTAEMLHEEAVKGRVAVSLATVYNTLHQFTEAGLLRQVAVDGAKAYFDTNVSEHHHFLVEGDNRLFDVPGDRLTFGNLPEPPEGMEIARIDVLVRLRPKTKG
jgi:Fur family iron response transcriptional regulator